MRERLRFRFLVSSTGRNISTKVSYLALIKNWMRTLVYLNWNENNNKKIDKNETNEYQKMLIRNNIKLTRNSYIKNWYRLNWLIIKLTLTVEYWPLFFYYSSRSEGWCSRNWHQDQSTSTKHLWARSYLSFLSHSHQKS